MKNIGIVLLLALFSSAAAAKHPLMERFDLDADGSVTSAELKASGCNPRDSKFKAADKNADGALSKRELIKAKHFLVSSSQCAKKSS